MQAEDSVPVVVSAYEYKQARASVLADVARPGFASSNDTLALDLYGRLLVDSKRSVQRRRTKKRQALQMEALKKLFQDNSDDGAVGDGWEADGGRKSPRYLPEGEHRNELNEDLWSLLAPHHNPPSAAADGMEQTQLSCFNAARWDASQNDELLQAALTMTGLGDERPCYYYVKVHGSKDIVDIVYFEEFEKANVFVSQNGLRQRTIMNAKKAIQLSVFQNTMLRPNMRLREGNDYVKAMTHC